MAPAVQSTAKTVELLFVSSVIAPLKLATLLLLAIQPNVVIVKKITNDHFEQPIQIQYINISVLENKR